MSDYHGFAIEVTVLRDGTMVERQPLQPSGQAYRCPYCYGRVTSHKLITDPQTALQIRVPTRTAIESGQIAPLCAHCGGEWEVPDVPCSMCGWDVAPYKYMDHLRICAGIHNERRAQVATALDVERWLFQEKGG